MTLALDAVPIIPRGVRVHFDKVRDVWVLLAPERAINLDPIGQAIMSEIDGERSFGQIIQGLSEKYNAPPEEITKDCSGFITALMNRRALELVT